jgi:hypothetical protein
VFPDSSLPTPTNGGFESQEKFRKYVLEHQNGKWETHLIARPTSDRERDYDDDTIGDAFPLQFPFGHTGLRTDPAVIELKERSIRKRSNVFKKLLRHRKPCFHFPLFILILENLLMKDTIFLQTQIQCNMKSSDNTAMGEKFGTMSADKLEKAIQDSRQNSKKQYSNTAEHRFLRSIKSSCGKLPHSNEACSDARRIYFSYLIKFGIPAIFLTITPDDLRNFRVVVYSLSPHKVTPFGEVDTKTFSETDILIDFNVRREARVEHPGFCAEEYQRMMELVIRHLFNWDTETQKSNGMGLFGIISAWCLATEEQGRKSLHGHYLLYVEDWNRVMNILQRRKDEEHAVGSWTFVNAIHDAKAMLVNACSAQLFSDFKVNEPLAEFPVFTHDDCRSARRPKEMRFSVKPVADQILREMRHKNKCHLLGGEIAVCVKCEKKFSVNEIIRNALKSHLGDLGDTFQFPEGHCKPVDRIVYEMGKDFSWYERNSYDQAIRYFAANAITNSHFTTHSQRCFKKGPECYTDLPDGVSDSTILVYNAEPDSWSDWKGSKEERNMLRFQPKRSIEDAYMNVNNPVVTKLLLCNNNVQVGINGRNIFYNTGYQVKAQQKEERHAFEKVSAVLCKVIQKQVRTINHVVGQQTKNKTKEILFQAEAEESIPSQQLGFRRILAGIYTHTSGHIVGAPMAHYNAINGSRFRYSHDHSFLPVHGLEGILKGTQISMTIRNLDGKQVVFNKAFNYLYRPTGMEKMSLYTFYGETKYIKISEAKKLGIEYFEYTEQHLFRKIEAVVYRTTTAVPTFPWNWIPSTRNFLTSILQRIDKDAPDHHTKEEYAFRFLILFVPFRSREDLETDDCYQSVFQRAYRESRISEEMILIAENIQTLHNSLATEIVENSLSAKTVLIETGDFEITTEDEDNDNYEDVLASIGELYATLTNVDGLKEDSECLDIQYGKEQAEESSLSCTELETVIEFSNSEDTRGKSREKTYAKGRFCPTQHNLNSLAMKTTITRTQANEGTDEVEKDLIDATGTWQSILKWGENEGLDDDQQTAFEILAATYVLTFCDEASIGTKNLESSNVFDERKKGLLQLARKDEHNETPLCMFITGPAGAGKCKSRK